MWPKEYEGGQARYAVIGSWKKQIDKERCLEEGYEGTQKANRFAKLMSDLSLSKDKDKDGSSSLSSLRKGNISEAWVSKEKALFLPWSEEKIRQK